MNHMITAHEKYETVAKIFIMKCFHPTLRITKSCCRAVPDDKFEVQIDPTFTNIGFSISALSVGDIGQNMEKMDNEIFMQPPGRQYLAMQGKQLRRETTNVKVRFCSTL